MQIQVRSLCTSSSLLTPAAIPWGEEAPSRNAGVKRGAFLSLLRSLLLTERFRLDRALAGTYACS